jgi:mRNA-degrading endonuclease toxin of MazEF toxin-antitoxin module
MPVPLRGDIVIAYFPQEDHSYCDLRPCLILSVNQDSLLAAKITTTELHRTWTYKLNQGATSMSKGTIQKDSWVNLRRQEIISTKDVKKTVGTLKSEVLSAICERIMKIINS